MSSPKNPPKSDKSATAGHPSSVGRPDKSAGKSAGRPDKSTPKSTSSTGKGPQAGPSTSAHQSIPPLKVGKISAQYLEQGHGWVTRDKELGDTNPYRPGQVISLVGPEGEWLAQALIDPDARVVARVISRNRQEVLDDHTLRKRVLQALARRASVRTHSSAYRVIHSEADGLPGLTVEAFGDYLVAQLYTPAAQRLGELALDTLMKTGTFKGAYLKALPRDRRQGPETPGSWVHGEAGPESLVVHEHGVLFRVSPFDGLSPGLFLDMRENRRIVAELARGKRLLNTFAYTGGFSVVAALQGAEVDTLDLSAKVLEQARENFRLNKISVEGDSPHRFIAQDTFAFLTHLDTRYGVVVLDPPTFSTSRESTWSPGRITELNALALHALEPDGLLVTFSNYAHMKEEVFLEAVRQAGIEARRSFQGVQLLQAGMDFPWLPGFPESRHLKGFVLRVA